MRTDLSSVSKISRTFVIGLVLIASVITPLTQAGAQDISARFLADYGNVTVMEVTGDFDEDIPDGTPNAAPRQAIAKEFFRTHKDEYDFVTIFTNFDFTMKPDAVAFYSHVKNDARGIGQEIYDNSDLYGSNGKLQGTIDMGNLLKLANNPLDPKFDFTTDIMIHETLHRWGAYVKFRDWNGTTSEALLGNEKAHWSFLFDSGGSTHYGNKWRDNGDGTFTSTAVRKYYSSMDLYLMGMIDKSKVPPTLLIDNPEISPDKLSELGSSISGTARSVSADDIIAVEGERVPSANDSPKQFKTAFIYVVTPGTFSANDLPALENIRNAYLTRFSILTDGKGLMQVASTPLDNLPTNPGIHTTATVPRTLPPNINDGLSWLINRQQADGSWTDFALTTERDTAESVATLQLFPTAQSQFQTGLNWLGTNGSITTDYLARRIEARVHAGSDSTSLVQELLARRNSDGGWGGGRNFVSSPTDTALALKALAASGYNDQTVTGKAIAYLQSTQNPDGGWSGDTSASVIQPTAAVLSAYNAYRKSYDLDAGIGKAVVFLAAKQNSDGGFGNSPSTIYDSSLALMALQSLNGDKTSIRKGMSYLLGQQAEDGSWNESPFQTALSMRAVWQATVEPDLSIKAEEINIIPATITALPTNAVLSATIQNLGRNDVPQAKVSIFEGSIDPDHRLSEQVLAFPGQSSVVVTFSIPVSSSTGHIYYAVVDPDNQIKEVSKDNNRAAKSLLPEITYDFQVQAADIVVSPNPVDAGNDVKIAVKVSNRGTSDAYNVPVRFFIDLPGSPVEVAQVTVDIPGGGSVLREITWRASLDGVNLPLTVQVDPNNFFTETSKDNNKASATLTVNTSTLPNLSVSYKDMIISPSPAREGGSASISVLVKNDGFSTVENVKVSTFKGLASNGGILLGTQTIPVIAAGQSVRVTTEWQGIAENGERLISVQVGSENSIQEISNDDNFTFSTLDILSLPDLGISGSAIVINPATPKSGDPVSVAVTVQNAGDQEALDVTVLLKEGDAVVGSTVIPLINGNSQESSTITYSNSAQTGSHRVSVIVDPDNSLVESTKDNNSASRSFTIQNANLWLSESYISPDGDGIKDSTDFFFRLAAAAKVTVQVVNKKNVAVRTFSGGELDSTMGTTITWDGKNDAGSVVDDGTYQIRAMGANSALLASLPVEVDTNRSPLAEALGTKYLLQSNQTCNLPYYSDFKWLPDESSLIFKLYPDANSIYPDGIYSMSPNGDDILRLIPNEWNSTGNPDLTYILSAMEISPDGQRVVFNRTKTTRTFLGYSYSWGTRYPNYNYTYAHSTWLVNTDGRNLTQLTDERVSANNDSYYITLKWSPDGQRIGMSDTSGLRVLNPETKAVSAPISGGSGSYSFRTSWSQDGTKILATYNNPFALAVADANGNGSLLSVGANISSGSVIGWMAGNKILISVYDNSTYAYKPLLFNPADSGIVSIAVDDIDSNNTTISLDGRYAIKLKEIGWNNDYSGISLINSAGNVSVVAEHAWDPNAPTVGEGENVVGVSSPILSADATSIAYIDTRYDETTQFIYDDLVVYNIETGGSRRVAASNYPSNNNGDYYEPSGRVNQILWMKNKTGFLIKTDDGAFLLNSEDGSRSDYLPVVAPDFLELSPNEHYLTFEQYDYSNSSCNPNRSYNQWAMSSLLNLTADLRITKNKAVIKLSGIASDKNFAGYRLEYADIRTSDSWNLIMPPSDIPVMSDRYIDWVPPNEGVFNVRLTVWDKAGNTTTNQKRVAWGEAALVTGLYRDNENIAPNNPENPRKTVSLHYTVLDAVHLEFTIENENGDTVRRFAREHAGYAVDSILWDGRDENGNLVPDGKFSIKLFDYEFDVEVDNTLPDVAIDLGRAVYDQLMLNYTVETNLTELGKSAISAVVTGHAYDKRLRKWIIEYGFGDNPSEWQGYLSGQSVVAEKDSVGIVKLPAKDGVFKVNLFPELVFLAGKKLRITAEDYAGNTSSAVSDYLQNQMVWQVDWNGSRQMITKTEMLKKTSMALYWEFLDKSVLNKNDSRDLIHFVYPGDIGVGSALEVLRFPVAKRVLQYFDSKSWVDSTSPVTVTSSGSIQADVPDMESKKFKAMRFVVTDVTGEEFVSNTIVVFEQEGYGVMGDGSDPCAQNSALCPSTSADIDIISGKSFDVIYPEALACGKSSNEIQLPTERLSLVGAKRVDYLVKVGTNPQVIGTVNIELEGPRRVSIDSSLLPTGSYPLSVIVTNHDNSQQQTDLGKVIVFDTEAPQSQLSLPTSPCPVRSVTSKGNRLGLEVSVGATDNINVAHYALYYGVGENPASWLPAVSMGNDGITALIAGDGAVSGRLGLWDITDIPGVVFTLKLEVVDAVGNKGCATGVVTVDREIKINGQNVAPLTFSPNADGNLDIATTSFSLDESATADLSVFTIVKDAIGSDTPGTLQRLIKSGLKLNTGSAAFDWDGKGDSGTVLSDNRYGVSLAVIDACGNTAVQWKTVELDNTQPALSIDFPLPGNPLPPGVMIEIKGSATDPHFKSYLLEAGAGDAPTTWNTLATSDKPITNAVIVPWNTYGLKDHWTMRLSAEDTVGNKKVVSSTVDLGIRKELVISMAATPKLFSPNNDQKLDTTVISYEVADACNIKVDLLDSNSRSVASFTEVTAGADKRSIIWNGTNGTGSIVPDGIYTIRLVASLISNPQITQTETLSLTVDNKPPTSAITDPAEKAFLNRTDLSVVGSIDDPNLSNYNVSIAGLSGTPNVESGIQNRENYAFGRIAGLSEDTYTVTIDAQDQGQNQSKLVRTFTIDRTPPKVALSTPNAVDYIGGMINTIDIYGTIVEKNLDRYSLRYGVGDAPIEWKEVVGADTAPGVEKLASLKVGKADGIADGLYTISLYAKDKAGLEGEAKTRIIIDNTPPDVALTSPKDGDYVTKAIDIKGTIADSYFDKGTLELSEGSCITAVKFAVIKTLSVSVQDDVLDSWKVLPADGEYCLKLSVSDKSGNKSVTKTGFRIDTHPPAVPTLTGKTENKTTNTLSWTKSPEADVAGYNLYKNSLKLNSIAITDLAYSDTGLKEGSYVYTVKAIDLAGNESESSNTVSLKIDLTGPTARITSPRDGSVVSNLVDVKGTAFSQDDFKEYRVHIGQGSNPSSWTLIRRSPLSTSYGSLAQWDTITGQEGSQYSIKLEAEDTSGNISTAQAVVTIDNTPPNSPLLLTNAVTGAEVALTWKANSETDLAGYLLYRNDQLANVSGIVAGNLKPYLVSGTTYTDKALADGTYSYYLVAMDQAGNSSDQSNTLEVTIDTRPPHMTITAPTSGHKFEDTLMVKAETPDNDIATVQFQYKRSQDVGWTNLGAPLVNSPFITYLNPKLLGLAYGDYQMQALAVDKSGKPDLAPPLVTVTYADLTPPDVPSGLAAKVLGAEVNLTWNAVSEAEASYNIYRWNAGAKSRINSAAVKALLFTDSAVPDGTYQYEVTATDLSGNESAASRQVTAKFFAPIIIQPFTPVKEPALGISGKGVDPNAAVEITTVSSSGETRKVMVTADASGNFKLEEITLGLGETSFSAVTSDNSGNVSKTSEVVYVAFGKVPAVPTGLTTTVQVNDVTLNWNANNEPDILGYYIYRDGSPLYGTFGLQPTEASASNDDFTPAANAIDSIDSSYWSNAYSSDGTFSPVWWQMTLPEPELINKLDLNWLTDWDYDGNQILYAGKDFEVQAWSGHNWVTIKTVVGNDQQYNELMIDPPYRTDRLRLIITGTTDPNDSRQVKLVDAYAYADDYVSSTTYLDNIYDGKYRYEVSAINQYGFVSEKAATDARVGWSPQTPTGLTAAVQGSDVVLNWNLNPVSDSVYYYNLKRWNGEILESSRWIYANTPTFTDSGIANGTYRYRVSALVWRNNGWLESDFSDYVSVTIAIVPPVAPSGLVVTAPASGKTLDIAWQPVSNASGYNLYRSNTQGGPYTSVDRWIDSPAYRDGSLVDGASYYYVVTTLDNAGNESSYSTEATGVPRDLFAQQPHIFKPTLPGTSVTTNNDAAEVAGFAEPGSHVDIKRNGVTAAATASVLEQRLAKALSLDNDYVSLSPDRGVLANVANIKFTLTDLSNNAVTVTLDLPFAYSGGTPLWSPSGRYLLFSGYDNNDNDKIAIYDRETTQMQLVSTGVTLSEYDASWSPSGDSFVFIGKDIDYNRSLWFGSPADGSVVRLADVGAAYDPKLSSDNSRIVFFDSDDALSLLNRSDGTVTMIDDNTDGNSSALSPDGSKLAFISYRDGDGDIYSYSISSGEITRRTFSQQDGGRLAWSPDGSYLGYRSYPDDNPIFTVVDTDGNEKVVFTASGDMYGNPEWRSNGDIIIFDQLGLHTIKPAGYFSATVNLVAGENSLTAVATDPAGNVSEPSEAITVFFDSGTLPDLAITDSDITFFPPVSRPGEETLVTARVRNLAGNAVDNVKVELYLWDGANDVTSLASETIAHIDAYGDESVAVRFNVGDGIGTRTVIAVADPSDAIQEVLETNNYAAKDLAITNLEGVRLTATLNSLKLASNQDMSVSITLLNSGLPANGILSVAIEDASGVVVNQLSGQPLELPYGLNESLPFTWNTGTTFSGNYRLHALLKNGTTVLAEAAVPFTILPDLKVGAGIVTDHKLYGANQNVGISASFTNAGLNYIIPQLKAKVQILDAQNSQLYFGELTATNIMPGISGTMQFSWNSELNVPGNYTAKVEYSVGDQVAGSASTAFSIIPVVSITGSLKAASNTVQPGEAIAVSYILTNSGNSAATGQALLALVDPDSLSVIGTMEQTVSIPMGGAQSGSAVFASENLLLKPYLVTLTYVSLGSRTPAGTVPVSIKDGIPPVLTVVSPSSGERFAGDVSFSVLASDNASGVARVEYSRDGGAWNLLPPADPEAGRYGFAWTPVAAENGAHSVSFRGTDRAGNTGSPFVVPFVVQIDITPPTGDVVINGGAGVTASNQVLLSLIASDESGVSRMRFSSDGDVWSDPETYATTRGWFLVTGDGLKRVYVSYQDMAGNWSVAPIVADIVLDTMPPTVSASPRGGLYNGPLSVTLSASESAVIRYTVDGSAPNVTSAIYQTPLQIASDTLLRFLASDSVGNLGDSTTESYTIDTLPPSLAVSTLADGSYTNNQVLNVAGLATDSSGMVSLTLNGTNVPQSQDGSFSQALVLQPGANTVSVVATDLVGNSNTDSRTINLDMTSPLLTVATPADNTKTASDVMNVTGTVDETSTVMVKLGVSTQQASLDGTGFSAQVTLIPGINTIDITATDLAGNTSTQKRTVVYDDQKPSLAVTDPTQDIRTNLSGLILRGIVSDPYTQVGVTVTMDGQSHTPQVAGGAFEQQLGFTQEKSYAIVVTATNEVGSSTETQRNVIYDITPPTLAINPVQSPTTANSVLISGTRETDVAVTVTCSTATVGTIVYPTLSSWEVQLSAMSLGEHIVTAQATDAASNVSTASAVIIVQQSGADIVLTPSPSIIWPPNHKMVPVTINGVLNVPLSDIKSLKISLIDEYGEYDFTNLKLGSTVLLEAWRNGNDPDGRKYTFSAVLTRKNGSKTTATAVVLVPHDMSGDEKCDEGDHDKDHEKDGDDDHKKDGESDGDDKKDDDHHND